MAIGTQGTSGAVHSKSQERTKTKVNQIKTQQNPTANIPKVKGPTAPVDPKSKSLERKQVTAKPKLAHAVMPKSILKKNQEQGANILMFKQALNGIANAAIEITPDKNQNHQGINGTSFLQSEHGRCQTSQVTQPNQSNSIQNGRTNSHQNLGSNHINIIFSKIKNNLTQQINQANGPHGFQRNQKDQSSPDRVKEFRPNGQNIDRLIRDNIKKVRSKEDEEKLLKYQADENQRKKRDWIEYKNNLVRKINKEKVYKKQQHQLQQVSAYQLNQIVVNQVNQQQAQDDSMEQREPQVDEKMAQINRNIVQREKFIQKQSQSQKIDFEKIKECSKGKKLNVKNHRKSYGLEFIDIKREIQEELRTLDLKFKNKELLLPDASSSQIKTMDNTQKPKKLKIKPQMIKKTLKPDETLPLSMISNGDNLNNYGSERMQPINKVLIVKKSKIRKFMKKKKKTLFFKQLQEQKDQILKIIKMQENQSKLNQYCKKNLEKHLQRKRNATLQYQPQQQEDEENGEGIGDQSRLSGRRITFDNIDKQKHIYEVMRDQQQRNEEGNDSSRLSTDFYEEYFRLINSIKKEQQASDNAHQSRADISSQNVTSKSLQNLLKSPINNSQSPIGVVQTTQISAFSPKPGDNSQQSQTHSKLKKKAKSKSNLKHTDSQILQSTNQKSSSINTIQKIQSISKNTIKTVGTADLPKLNTRAESAPLMIHQSLKKKSVIKHSPQRKHSPSKDPKDKPKKASKKKQSAIETSQENLPIPKRETKKSRSEKKRDEDVAFRYFLSCVLRIQRSYRTHLLERGFYESFVDNDMQQSLEQLSSSEKDYQTQIFNGGDNTIFDQDVRAESPEKLLLQPQVEEYEEESDYDEEEVVNVGSANMIIIDQKSNDDQKKVVYMSNINSYSVPQSPKGGEDASPNQNLLIKGQGEGAKKKAVFEYKPGMIIVQPSQFFSQSLSATDQIHQQISQKPSLESNLNSESGQLPIIDKQSKASSKEQFLNEPLEEIKELDVAVNPSDYQMRLFMGSESLLREFKHNTPKQQQQRKEVGELAQRESVQSNKTDSRKSQSLADQTSHSSQSVFERNSFQQFTMQKLQQMMNNNEYMNLIEMREKALEYRKTKEKKFIRKMLKDKKFSPRTYTKRKEQLEKWVQVEKEEIQRTKTQFKAEWQKTVQMIEDTQKNVEQMRVKIDNRFNSANSSRNSQSSYMTNKPEKPRKSILEQEEYQPLSQRSMRMSICSQITIEQNKSVNHQLHEKSNKDNQKKLVIQDKLASDSSQPASSDHQRDNLMDFLEKSWQKTQLKQSHLIGSIYVEDQKEELFNKVNAGDSYTPIDSEDLHLNDPYLHLEEQASEIDRHSTEQRPSIENFMNPGFDERFEEDKQKPQIQQIIKEGSIHHNQNERSLVRSRSEQDLSELIRNNQINFNDLDISDQNLQRKGGRQEDEGDSFKLKKKTVSEIKIQENLFDDSSHRFLKDKEFYHESHDHQQSQDQHDEDSLLNESELNNYFQDQKFSIEDFKSLDKKKIIDHAGDLLASERLKEAASEGTDRHQRQQRQDDSSSLNEMALAANGGIAEQSSKEMKEDEEPSFSMLQRPGDTVPRVITPDHLQQTAFLQHQQAFLFQNTRPGENIKISDILKKNQNMTTDAVVVSSFTVDSQAAAVFQNQHINQSMSMPALQPLITDPQLQLKVEAITEEILAQLLVSEIRVPKRDIGEVKQPEQPQKPVEQVLKIEPENQAAGDVFMIDSQQSEKEMRREMVEYRQRMVIEQDLIRVENYINEVIHSLQQSELTYLTLLANNVDPSTPEITGNYHRAFLNVLTQPIKRQELEILNQLQTSEIGSYDHFETAQDLNTNPILPIDLYLEIERQREEAQLRLMYINGQQEVDLENSIIQESSHIHNKGIFDALNESLMKFRPYGISGEPMPWSNKNRRLQTKVDTNSVDTERLFMMVKQDVLRWAQVFSGSHPSPIFICKRQENSEGDVFDEELFQETRERRLAQMLAADVVENEHQWLNYEFEEAQVKVDLSDMILEHLVEEITLFLNFKQDLLIQQPQIQN